MKIYVPHKTGIFLVAAREFAELWRKVTGESLPVTDHADGTEDLIVLGGDQDSRFVHDRILDGTIPRFRIRVGSDDYELLSGRRGTQSLLFIAGGSRRALLYGVYRFFELAADCRYFWDGDIVPRRPSLRIAGWNVYESPRFEYRGLRYFAHRGLHRFQALHWNLEEWKHEIDFLLKKRFNLFMLRMGLVDLFQKAFPEAVPYPKGFEIEGSVPRSYDDHTLFMPLEERGRLHKQILDYAFERGLLHPEDVGTMTHWYSRTPMDFIRAFRPSFLPQASDTYYVDPTGRVWDIRDDENLERYYKLTQAHIRCYGSPAIFHTIGLSERQCYSDHASNHQMKLYAYNRIIGRLRRDYPDAPLLISSWEFLDWTPEEVRGLLETLDGDKTVILDYIADIQDEHNCFITWGLEGKRKWIFGIFHSNENNSEFRGNYALIEERLKRAAADPMCCGMVLWPETSHADTLMIEYVAANAWNPVHVNVGEFLAEFCAARYPDNPERMLRIWRLALPSIRRRIRFGLKRKDATALMFFIRPLSLYPKLDAALAVRYLSTLESFLPVSGSIHALLGELALLADSSDNPEFTERDLLDLAKSAGASVMDCGWAAVNTAMENWRNGAANGQSLRKGMRNLRRTFQFFSDILKASEEFSLYRSLLQLREGPNRNPDFESTLKGNAENSYSRSFVPEIIDACAIPELEVFISHVERKLAAGKREYWIFPDSFQTDRKRIQDRFYERPLREMAPDCAEARRNLKRNLLALRGQTEKIMSFANQEYSIAKEGVSR